MPRLSLLQRSVQRLKSQLDAAAETTVELRSGSSGGEAIEGLQAIPGRKNLAEFLADQAGGTALDCDWIVSARDLTFPEAGRQEPKPGWQIRWREPESARLLVFDVRPVAEGARCYDPVDQLGILYRLHSQFIGLAREESA